MSGESAFRFPETFVWLAADGSARPLEVTESFWPDLMAGRLVPSEPAGRLVSFYRFDADWDAWERHPAGEELVCLVSGALDLLLETPDGTRVVALREPGAFALVPRNTWHSARVPEPCQALFVTAGAGTEHRPA